MTPTREQLIEMAQQIIQIRAGMTGLSDPIKRMDAMCDAAAEIILVLQSQGSERGVDARNAARYCAIRAYYLCHHEQPCGRYETPIENGFSSKAAQTEAEYDSVIDDLLAASPPPTAEQQGVCTGWGERELLIAFRSARLPEEEFMRVKTYLPRFPQCQYPKILPECDPSKTAEQQGVFRKFEVKRTDGSDQPGGKHEGCEYFVLDVDHDPHAQDALYAYTLSCRHTHPQLSKDMIERYDLVPPAEQGGNPDGYFYEWDFGTSIHRSFNHYSGRKPDKMVPYWLDPPAEQAQGSDVPPPYRCMQCKDTGVYSRSGLACRCICAIATESKHD